MREKPANEGAIARLIGYLNDVYLTSKANSTTFSAFELHKYHQVAKRTTSDCRRLKIFQVNEDKTVTWLDEDQPARFMALRILDYRLKKTKKTIHVPIPDFAGIADTLQTIGERLAQLAVQNEKWLKRAKNDENGLATEGDLFRVEDQRLYIAGQIASRIYKDSFEHNPDQSISRASDFVIKATDDLMKKLLNNDRMTITNTTVVGNCGFCKKEIHENDRYAKKSNGEIYCLDHVEL